MSEIEILQTRVLELEQRVTLLEQRIAQMQHVVLTPRLIPFTIGIST